MARVNDALVGTSGTPSGTNKYVTDQDPRLSGGGSVTPVMETPTGTVNGVNAVFTLSNTPSSASGVFVWLNGVNQRNGADFTVTGATINFVAAPVTGSEIFAAYNIASIGTAISASVATVAADYTLSLSDGVVKVDTSGGAVTVTLPLVASSSGRRFTVKRITGGANACLVDGNGANIDGYATLTIPDQFTALDFVSDGIEWSIV